MPKQRRALIIHVHLGSAMQSERVCCRVREFVLFPPLLRVCVSDMNHGKSLTSLVALAAAAAVGLF